MEDSTSSADSPQNASATETVIITPSQLEKMGLIVRSKDSYSESQVQKAVGNEQGSKTSPENQKEFKIDPRKIKNKLCTLLNHTPLVMQVKDINWMPQERKDKEGILVDDSDDDDGDNNRGDDEQDEVPKFKIVSDEKSNLSAVEIENMLSSAKIMKSDDAISSPLQKNRVEEVVVKSEAKVPQSTSKESTNDAGILKKECLKRIQAKMYENLKKVLNEVDSLPVKDKACLRVKPVMNTDDTKTIICKISDAAAKATEKAKENKPCYMSVYRERKTSQDAEKVKEEIKIEIDATPEPQHNKPKTNKAIIHINNGDEIIKIEDDPDDIVRIPKKRKLPPPETARLYRIIDDAKGTVIEIADNDVTEQRRKDNKPLKKSIVSQFYRNVQNTERKKSPSPQMNKVKRAAKMINTSKSPKQNTPRRRGRPRKIPKVETISIVVEEIDDSEAEKEVPAEVEPEITKTSSNTPSQLPPRKRGRPPKNKNPETRVNTQTPKTSSTPQVPESDAPRTESNQEEIKPEQSQETTPVVRKRGRPRKIPREVSESAGKSSSHTENPAASETKSEESQDNNNTPVEVKVPKKRGRKSKAELAALRKNEPEPVEEVVKDKYAKSRTSGRKRKVIDYNMLNGEDSDVEEQELKMQKVVTSSGRVIRRTKKARYATSSDEDESSDSSDHKRTEDGTNDEDASDRDDDDEDESSVGKELEKSDDKDEEGKEMDEDHDREEKETKELEDAKISRDVLPKKRRKAIKEDKLTEDKPDEDKKLIKHEEKSLKHEEKSLKQEEKSLKHEEKSLKHEEKSLKHEEKEEDDADEKDNLQPPKEELESEDIPKPKTELKDDEVRCAICEEVVQEDLWSQHKRKFHNDLAWFAGEQALNLEDTALVEEKLNAILSEDGLLKCVACDIQTDSVESFVEHKKDCKMYIPKHKTCDITESGVKGKKKRKPGGPSEVLSYLFTNFAKNLKDEPSESKDEVADQEVEKVEDKDDIVPQEDLPVIKKDQTQCAICLKVLPKPQWFNHKLSMHNNLAWKMGDTPLDLNDKSVVLKILHELYLKKKPLYCDLCGGTRKSVLGFLSHKSQCKKSNQELAEMKVKCNLCNRQMLLVSMSRHMVLSHSGDSVVDEQPAKDIEEDTSGKRKAADRAFQLIRSLKEEGSDKKDVLKGIQFRSVDEAITKFNADIQRLGQTTCVYDNCAYVATETEDLLQHMEDCTEKCNEGPFDNSVKVDIDEKLHQEVNIRESIVNITTATQSVTVGQCDGYTCNFCLATFQYKRSAKEHILAVHPDGDKDNLVIQEESSDEDTVESKNEDVSYADDEIIYQARTPRKLQKRNQQHPISVRFLAHLKKKIINCCYPSAYKWTLEYHKENYTAESLFSNVLCDESVWKRLYDSKVLEYLPKLKRSIDIATLKLQHINVPSKEDYQWTSYKLFESAIDADGTSTIFCGGPVSALAWVPIPYSQRNMDQILAVSVLPDPDEMYYGTKIYRHKGMIQFWNHGVLKNKSKPDDTPKLEFCLVHDYGIVWCMEWCPSGCYGTQEDTQPLKRLGLLALACSDSNVYIYAVPKPAVFTGKIFQPKPSFKLILEGSIDLDLGELAYHATKLSWSKASGHSYLAVGYSNGVIAIFNLNTESKLLSETIDGVVVLKPAHAFKAHNDVVTALVLHHMDKGNRWLMSGSLDRESKMWDLRNTSEPLHNIKKYIITDGVWIMHWLCPTYTFQHSTVYGAVPSGLIPARCYNGTMSTFLPSNSNTTCLSGSDWGNLFIQANDCGDVVCGFPDQLLYGFDNDKRRMIRRCRMLASYTAYVAKHLTPEERLKKENTKMKILDKKLKWNDLGGVGLSEPKSYNEACNSYGIVFCDMDKTTQYKDPTKELDKLLQSPPFHSMAKPDMYPLQSINKIVLNPNKNSYLFYACGYQVGFVRTSSLMFLNNNQNVQ